ncbi:hypothetical protein A2853_03535 [Candidatus Kaiserbacteria bacterium RIFCSPHIGHO2_01_FULL_55_17]|uniref:Methyltransferase small domain-containing protein n=1 Tax=Candidatus Kaiserbacteria bacterium RIFCSPHIGHO2_01_FULL_55_17 TaxID=1798484 RepID=A0A1F6D9F3_9BACT|nr:MAG: hypothetical protein A2853_03535 [Candidatus Kaiserbacteria bacterium RIFCSPHIGHO2_01_FULL_55_17]
MTFGSMDKKFHQKPDDDSAPKPARLERPEWQEEVLAVFDKMRSHKELYEMKAGKFSLTILPNVFSPKYFTDSLWFAETLPEIVGKKRLLEVGPGTGIISLYCADAGAAVTATDINPEATKNTELNAKKNGLDISVRNGDMFAAIRDDEKFDVIFWNHPFNNWNKPVDEMLLRAGLDEQYAGLRKYTREARKYLDEGGQLLLGTGDMADIQEIEKIAEENGYQLTLLRKVDLPLEADSKVLNSYLIYRFDKKES